MRKGDVLAIMILPGLAGCAGFGGGGYPGGYGYPGPYGYYPGAYGGYGYYPPPRPYYPRYTAPPMTPEQRQLKYLYDNRDQIGKLPPKQQKQIARKVRKLLKDQ